MSGLYNLINGVNPATFFNEIIRVYPKLEDKLREMFEHPA